MRDIKVFEFPRGELFFQPMLTFSLAVTGFHAIVRPDSLVARREGSTSYRLGGLILGGLVCGSVLNALEVAQSVKMGREVNRVAFEEDSFNDPHEGVTPSGNDAGGYWEDVGGYLKAVASVCIVAAFQSIEGSLRGRLRRHLEWPPEAQYLRHLRNAASHGNEFRITKPGLDPDRPPRWRTSVMPSVDAMAGKQLFNEFLRPGDIPVLLSDIRHLLRFNE